MTLWALRVALLCVACPSGTAAQGLPFHTPSALTTAFEERGVRTFTAVQARGDMVVWATPVVLLPYAPHQRVTSTISVPLLRKSLDPTPGGGGQAFSNTGLGDVTASLKWAFFVRDRFAGTSRLALIVSARLPTGATDERLSDGQAAPRPLQLGSGSAGVGTRIAGTWVRDRWGFTSSIGRTRRGPDGDLDPGGVTLYDVAIGYRFPARIETIDTRTVQLYLEWNGSVAGRAREGDLPVASSGGHVAYVSPGVQWVVAPQVLLEGSLQIPVVQHFNGSQVRFGARPAVGLRYLFF